MSNFQCCCLIGQKQISTRSEMANKDAKPENHAIVDQNTADEPHQDEDTISELTVVYKGITYSLKGDLKTRYIEEGGFFVHTIVYDESQKNEDSVCFAKLKLRENDQFLLANKDDLTLMSHVKVLDFIRNLPINERISLVVARHDESSGDIFVVEYIFKFIIEDITEEVCERRISVYIYSETETGYSSYRPRERTVTMLKTRTNQYLQLKEDTQDTLIFKELVSEKPVGLCAFIKCHFIERKRLEIRPAIHFIRTYENAKYGWFMFVKPNGELTLCQSNPQDPASKGETPTEFLLQSSSLSLFMVLKEVLGNRYMKYVNAEAWFEEANVTRIDLIDRSFRYEVRPLYCTE